MNIWAEIAGYVAGLCIATCFLPQTLQTIKTKNVQDLSLWSYIIYCTGMICWVFYGIYLHSVQMILFNLISLYFAGTILYMIIRYKNKSKKNGEAPAKF